MHGYVKATRCTAAVLLALAAIAPVARAGDSAPAAGFSSDALYNLGNDYARRGRPGLAILNYQRASLLAPNDPDVQANLDYVREEAHLPVETRSRLAQVLLIPGATLVAWLGLAGLLLCCSCLLAGRLATGSRALRRSGAVIGLALIALAASNAALRWRTLHAAVVITDAAPVRESPVPMGNPLFTLPEAETVQVTAQHDEYLLVRTRAGKTGWVSKATVVPVVPDS